MKVAVVGAGYAGLATTWYLLQRHFSVTVFDGGEGASFASTGLLHVSPGKKAKPIWQSREGMEAAIELLEVASRRTPVFVRNGLLRTVEQKMLWVPDGITVFSKLYLKELRKACGEAQFETHQIGDLQELASFDAVILTVGAEVSKWVDLPLKRVIGQSLLCRCKEPLGMSLLSHGHITPTEHPELCLVGSTYEHTNHPDPQKALALLDQVAQFYPLAKDFKVVEVYSGTRVSPKVGYQPIIQKIGPKTWIFTGLGSKGLIYHSLFAKKLSAQLDKNLRDRVS